MNGDLRYVSSGIWVKEIMYDGCKGARSMAINWYRDEEGDLTPPVPLDPQAKILRCCGEHKQLGFLSKRYLGILLVVTGSLCPIPDTVLLFKPCVIPKDMLSMCKSGVKRRIYPC